MVDEKVQYTTIIYLYIVFKILVIYDSWHNHNLKHLNLNFKTKPVYQQNTRTQNL